MERKPCPGCGIRMIPWFGLLCSVCTNFPSMLYPYRPIKKDLAPRPASAQESDYERHRERFRRG